MKRLQTYKRYLTIEIAHKLELNETLVNINGDTVKSIHQNHSNVLKRFPVISNNCTTIFFWNNYTMSFSDLHV